MPAPPLRKISETILDFGDPLISQVNVDDSGEELRSVLKIVILVWNAHVLAMPRWGQAKTLADLHEQLRDPEMPPEMVETIRALSQRRLERFATDARAVGEWSVVNVAGEWRLRCDARAPSQVM